MAFISSAKNSSGKGEVNTASILTDSTYVSLASADVAAASISHDTVCAYIASQSNGSEIKYKDINQIDEDDIKEMDIKWNMALLSMRADRFWKKTRKKITIRVTDVAGFDKSKVECFNCHKMGYFARECRTPRSQDRGRREIYKQGFKEEESAPKALIAIDGVGWDWSYMANEEENHALVADDKAPTKFVLMAKSSSSSKNKVFDNSLYSKSCKKNTDSLNTKITELSEKLSNSKTNLYHYKLGLSQVEARLVEFKTQEIKLCEKIKGLEFDVKNKYIKIKNLLNELEQIKKEKEGLDSKLTDFESASKDLDTLLGRQRSDKKKEGLGYGVVPPSCSSLLFSQERYFHEAYLDSSTSNAQDACNANASESSGNSNPTATSTNPSADQMETLTVESAIPTVSSPVLTACLDVSQEPSSTTRLISKRVTSQDETPSPDNISTLANRFEDILGVTTNTVDTNGVEADIFDALKDPSWVEAMQEELLQFKIQNVWILVDCPTGEEGIDYEEVFAPVARIEAIRLFLAYVSFIGFTVYQMDVKSVFLYGTIDEEVYVMQPPGFQDPKFPDRVFKVEKAMYGLHQAPRAWYGTLSKYLLTNGFQRGTIDQTLFIQKHRGDFLLVQVYVDDIIFGSSNPQLCREFEALMHDKFQMSAMGELNFFLGLQVLQKKDGIFLSQDKYVGDILKNFGYLDVRPDIMFAVCACARHQVTTKECHLHAVKRIFRYLKGHLKLGLWYPKESPFDLVAYSDSDYGGATQDKKSTTGGCQFLGRRLISWQCKKQTIAATSTTEAEYLHLGHGHLDVPHVIDEFGKPDIVVGNGYD
nr:hypothetical protein [Tanacetum cinerariifolium]